MKIFIASGIFHPDSGGPATYLYRLLPELQARGHEVRALAYGNAPTNGYPYPLTRIPFAPLPIRMINYARTYRQGVAWADLIYLNSFGLPRTGSGDSRKPRVMKIVGDYAWERANRRGWIPPDEQVDDFQARRYGPLVEWGKASRSREAQTVDRIIVPSEYLRKMVIGWGVDPKCVQVVYNALDMESVSLNRTAARTQLGWRQQGRYLITVGRLVAWKGVDYLIDALAQLPDVTLIVAGDGPCYGVLQAQAASKGVADRVRFLGKVPHDQLPVYLRAADYLALYSGYEGLSHTILEALYVGTPVIASDKGGNPEVVRHDQNGLLVVIRYALSDGAQARLAAGTQQGLDRFEWSCLVEQTVKTLVEVGTGKR
jgi:glycosyltransferase involved in cell wall biosynthesis